MRTTFIQSKVLLDVTVALLFLLSLTDCKRGHVYDWQLVNAPDGSFTISFPANPTLEEKPTASLTGGAFVSHTFKVKPADGVAYMCGWWEDPSQQTFSIEERLNKARDRGVGGVRGVLISEKRISVQGYPARDIKAIAAGNAAFDNRLILVGSRLYSLMVLDRSGNHDVENVQKFFNSLTIR